MRDKHESVRAASATALGKIADVSVISPLTRALRDKHESVRAASATALGEIADVSVISPLTRALRDRSHRVRHNALIALKQIRRDELVVPHLANLLQDLKSKSYGLKYYDDYTSYEVVKILKQIGTTEALAAVNSYETHEPLRGIGGEKY